MNRALTLAALGLALSSCGGPAESDLQLTVTRQGLAAVSTYDVRVLGGAVACSAVNAARADFRTLRTCEAAEFETAKDCHIAHAQLKPGATNRLDAITSGKRVVFVIGLDANKVPVANGCSNVEVKDGAAARVTVTVSDGF